MLDSTRILNEKTRTVAIWQKKQMEDRAFIKIRRLKEPAIYQLKI